MKRLAPCLLFVLLSTGCGEPAYRFESADPLDAKVSGEKAFSHVAALVDFGPRPAGSEALEHSRQYLEKELAALKWSVRRQTFTEKTPVGEVEFTNLRARFGEEAWETTVEGLLCSHYDTKRYEQIEFVGANDGGSSTGLLVELARVLSERPEAARRIELVFFDGEEAFGTNITARDGLYGSKHYAGEWLLQPEAERPRWGVLLDMVGDADLNIRAAVRVPRQSIRDLAKAKEDGSYVVDIEKVEESLQFLSRYLLDAAGELDLRSHIGVSPDYIIDDHIPLNVVSGIPTIDLIDFEFPPWHTPGDTLDKISAESLEITGRVTLRLVEKYLLPGDW
ncbi:MAG: M28 family peptidase [Verrucomicrobiae bacterium]|nr:M28 family peptidase [Verrucomicrobiae bacterium]